MKDSPYRHLSVQMSVFHKRPGDFYRFLVIATNTYAASFDVTALGFNVIRQ